LSFDFGMAKGLIVTRISAAAAISICWLVFNPLLAHAQPDRSESKCFPWQELRDGNCVAKATPAPAIPAPCDGSSSDATGRCVCPADTHLDAGNATCVADIKAPRKANDSVVCDGGISSNGTSKRSHRDAGGPAI
jgi:hypothetical protein